MANNSGGKPSASKTTKRVKPNNIFAGTEKSGLKKRSTATKAKTAASVIVAAGAVKAVRKAGGKTLLTAFICFILALAVGAGICFFLGRNDKFDLLGEDHIYLQINEKYSDSGVDIREFGLNFSNKAVIETDLETDSDGNYYAESSGDYYISYTVKSLKFGLIYPVRKIRLVSVIGESEGGL